MQILRDPAGILLHSTQTQRSWNLSRFSFFLSFSSECDILSSQMNRFVSDGQTETETLHSLSTHFFGFSVQKKLNVSKFLHKIVTLPLSAGLIIDEIWIFPSK